MDFVSPYEFRKCVDRYQGRYKVKTFSCWDQFLCLAFAQLTYRGSLRDIQFARLYRLHQALGFFVTRAKRNFRFRYFDSRAVDRTTGVHSD